MVVAKRNKKRLRKKRVFDDCCDWMYVHFAQTASKICCKNCVLPLCT
jgi:hypothetical protein